MKTILLFLAFIAGMYAQNPGQIQFTTTDPTGVACGARSIKLRTPNGTVYTCQSGTYAAITGSGGSGFGTTACTSPSVAANAVTLSFTAPVNCNKFTITAATTVTLPTPASNAAGPVWFEVTNSGPVTGTNIIYAGASETGLPTTVEASANNAVTLIGMIWDGSKWNSYGGTCTTCSTPAAGTIPVATSTGSPGAATAANVVSLFSACSGTQYLGADGACHAAGGATTNTQPSWIPWGTTYGGAQMTVTHNVTYAWLLDSPRARQIAKVYLNGLGGSGAHYAWAVYPTTGCPGACSAAALATGTAQVGCGGCANSAALSYTFAADTTYYLVWSWDTDEAGVVNCTASASSQQPTTGTITPVEYGTAANATTWAAGVPTFPGTLGAITASASMCYLQIRLTY